MKFSRILRPDSFPYHHPHPHPPSPINITITIMPMDAMAHGHPTATASEDKRPSPATSPPSYFSQKDWNQDSLRGTFVLNQDSLRNFCL
eukprot:scaffold1933_cov145-Skeletonema_dohrnii-CCMP3373.AAC.2